MKSLKKALRKLVLLGLKSMMWLRNFLGLRRSGIVILLYHNIEKADFPNFRNQMEFLRDKYGFLSYTEFDDLMKSGKKITGTRILLTFDDGFASNKHVADMILNPLGIKSVFFVPAFLATKSLTSEETINFISHNIKETCVNAAFMTLDEMKQLIADGHTIGSHSFYHKNFATLESQEQRDTEMVESARILEAKLGHTISALAYPFGEIQYINGKCLQTAQVVYQYVFSGIRGVNGQKTSRLALRRDSATPDLSLRDIEFIVEGGFSPVYYLKRQRLDKMLKNVPPSPNSRN